MNLKEITKPITVESLNETLAKRFGKKLNVQNYTNEQLDDARNKLRTQLSSIETTESFDDVHKNDKYQKSKLMLDILNAEISERENIAEFSKDDEKEADKDSKKMQKKGSHATSSPSQGGKKTNEGISPVPKDGKCPNGYTLSSDGKRCIRDKKMDEGAKPDFADIDDDGNETEPMTKAAQDKKEKGGDDKKDDSKGLSAKQKKLPAGLQKAIAKKNESYTDYLKNKLHNKRKYQTLEESVGKPITEEEFDVLAEKQDACYHKVKSRYKVWPSAYASGALVQCRKKGAKNWGNKSK